MPVSPKPILNYRDGNERTGQEDPGRLPGGKEGHSPLLHSNDLRESTVFTTSLYKTLKELQWGAWSLVSLYISILSGIVVALQYDYATPYYSATALDLLVPFGSYFRSLHFYSSQFFFLFSCAHLLAIFEKTESYTRANWIRLVMTLPLALVLLFSGYILRGDNTGFSAGMIAEAILHTIPVLGSTLDNTLFSITDHGMQRVYVHHVITFDVLWLMLAWDHLRRYRVKATAHLPLVCLTLGFCLFIAAPLEPEKLGTTYISGPWFFLGLQELLRYLHPLIAGVIFPASFLAALFYAQNKNRYFRYTLWYIVVWLSSYSVLTYLALIR